MSRSFPYATGPYKGQNDPTLQLPSTSSPTERRGERYPVLEGATHWLVLAPWHSNDRGFNFEPIVKECIEGKTLVILTRGTEPSAISSGDSQSAMVTFASRVVSRNHGEIWCEPGGTFYIRDTSSSSGTFLNKKRLGTAGQHSAVFRLKDGDRLQLGNGTHHNGEKDIRYRAVSMRVVISPGKKGIGSETQESTSASSEKKRPLSADYDSTPSDSPLGPFMETGPHSSRSSQWYGSSMGEKPGIGTGVINGPRGSSSDAAAPPQYRTPSPDFEVDNALSRYAAQNRHDISPELERKLRKAYYMPEDDPDEITSEEWQSRFGVGYFELKRLRHLYSRNFGGTNGQ